MDRCGWAKRLHQVWSRKPKAQADSGAREHAAVPRSPHRRLRRPCAERASQLSAQGLKVLARATAWQGVIAGDVEGNAYKLRLLQQSLALLGRPKLADWNTRREAAFALREMGWALAGTDREEAVRLWGRSLELYRELGDRWGASQVLRAFALTERNLNRAGEWCEQSMATHRALEDLWGMGRMTWRLGGIYAYHGQAEQAELYALASRYPHVANSRWFEDVAGHHIRATAATLPPEVVAAV